MPGLPRQPKQRIASGADGGTGMVYQGEVPTVEPVFSKELQTQLGWADEVARLKVFANADTPGAAQKAVEFGAMGIGLCRTERMFNDVERLPIDIRLRLGLEENTSNKPKG